MMKRREFTLSLGIITATLASLNAIRLSPFTKSHAQTPNMDNSMTDKPEAEIDWAHLSEREWQDRLTEMEFYVLRKEGTERAGTSALNDEKRKGTFVCAGCTQPLFSSHMKYDSGTGWPSFFKALDGALGTKEDRKFFMKRTEYHCSRCGGHQGHVFKDGPPPTGLRYCNNGVALNFIPSET